jgi:CUB/sushi domain-containing protein
LIIFGPSLVTCNMKTGVWSALPECGCSDPSTVANAHIKRTGPTTASYNCSNGLKFLGTANLKCDPRRNKWNGPLPRCSCQDPAPIANAVSERIDSDAVTYRCNVGFELIGSSNISCNNSTGQWSTAPKCRCLAPPLPWKLTAVHRTEFSIKYKCNDEFELVGNSPVYCDRTTGQWDPLPKCRCMAPPTPENATTVKRDGTFIQYKCNERFKMIGNANISCDESGQWTTRPNCIFLRHFNSCNGNHYSNYSN